MLRLRGDRRGEGSTPGGARLLYRSHAYQGEPPQERFDATALPAAMWTFLEHDS